MAGPSRARGDRLGTALALALGALVGVLVGAPAVPGDLSVSVGATTLGSVEAALLLGVFAVVLVPVAMMALYQVFALVERR